MMVEFVNATTGGRMWVAEERQEEYKAAGHKLAVPDVKPTEKPRRTARKTVKK